VSDENPIPPAALLVRHPVADFDTWKTGFDAHQDVRRSSGIVGHHINRDRDDPNMLSVYLGVADIGKARAFASSDDLKSIMEQVGVTGPPEMTWMTPAREALAWDRELPAMIVSHSVADFDTWLAGYDAADNLRVANGIVGHAANRLLDDESVAVVYHQAESFETLQAFLENPDLQATMHAAGVTSEPELSFHTGGWGKFYD
jgi:hypothetical protein